MSTNHRERLERVVDKALKEAALGEPYGFAVSGPGVWPLVEQDQDGQPRPVPPGPAWFVLVTIRAAGLGEPDIGNGFPVPGVLPRDADFQTVARGLLARCRAERDNANATALQAAGPSMKLSDRPKP